MGSSSPGKAWHIPGLLEDPTHDLARLLELNLPCTYFDEDFLTSDYRHGVLSLSRPQGAVCVGIEAGPTECCDKMGTVQAPVQA